MNLKKQEYFVAIGVSRPTKQTIRFADVESRITFETKMDSFAEKWKFKPLKVLDPAILFLSSLMNRKLFVLFFKVVCVSGFLYQVSDIAELYFKYQTTSSVDSLGRDSQEHPTLVFCVRYLDLIDQERSKLADIEENTFLYEKFLEKLSRLTSKQIFDLTPATDNIVKSCILRNESTDIMEYKDQKSCSQLFSITKLLTGQHVCYFFDSRSKERYFISEVASSLTFPNEVYSIYLHRDFLEKFRDILVISYFSGDAIHLPIYSRNFAEKIVRPKQMNGAQLFIHAMLTSVKLQSYPYDTDCNPDELGDWMHCFHNCIKKAMKKVHRLPWSVFIEDGSEAKILSWNDMKNKSILRYFRDERVKCRVLCGHRNSCNYIYTRTKAVLHSNHYGSFRVSAMTPFGPDIYITANPRMILIEFIVHVGSCFGLWFGISVLSMDPSKYNLQIQEKVGNLIKKTTSNELMCLKRQSNSIASPPKSSLNHKTRVVPYIELPKPET